MHTAPSPPGFALPARFFVIYLTTFLLSAEFCAQCSQRLDLRCPHGPSLSIFQRFLSSAKPCAQCSQHLFFVIHSTPLFAVCRLLRTVQLTPRFALPARSISINFTALSVVCQAVRTVQSTPVLCHSLNAALCCLQSSAHSAVSVWTCVARTILIYSFYNALCRLPCAQCSQHLNMYCLLQSNSPILNSLIFRMQGCARRAQPRTQAKVSLSSVTRLVSYN